MLYYPPILTIQSYVAFSLSIVINVLALILIATKSPSELGQYRIILYNFSINDLIFTTISTFGPMQVLLSGSTTTVYIAWGPLARLSASIRSDAVIALFGITLAFFVYSIALIIMAFVYRYNMLCRLFRPSNVQLQLSLVSVFISTLIIPITFYFSTIPTDQLVNLYNSRVVIQSEQLNATTITDEYVIFGTDFSVNLLGLFPTAMTLLSFIPAYVTVIWCFMKIYRYLKERRSSLSPATLRMQKNLLVTLTAQSLLPAICVATPGVNYVVYLLDSSNQSPVFQFIAFTLPQWLPAINPLLTITLIPSFRRGLFAWFRRHSPPTTNTMPLFQNVHNQNVATIL